MPTYRAKAPLRLGLAGGGTDLSTYSAAFGGAIMNATINLYAYASITPTDDGRIVIESIDQGIEAEFPSAMHLEPAGKMTLIQAVYNRVVKDLVGQPLSFRIATWVDAPPGSGLGSSSTLVVAILGSFVEWLKLPLGEYDIAQLAWRIERVDLAQDGGKQDQYAAVFGGFNFMEFKDDVNVIVNPLRIKSEYVSELEFNILLYYTLISRYSSDIIKDQEENVSGVQNSHLQAMHELKRQAYALKETLLKGELNKIGPMLNLGWEAKKATTSKVSNSQLDAIYETALQNGSTGGKLSGAGGGGFFMFYCPGNTRYKVIQALHTKFGGEFRRFQFTMAGLASWESRTP
ncbi:MAG: dehydrogenase [Acidobacteriota bacterium]|jgi:D-glycero-alpha-D-manno-heptose-7-phosphate kinase